MTARTWRRLAAQGALGTAVAATLAAGPVLAALAAPPPADGPLLAVVAPWRDAAEVARAAGAAPVGLAAPMALLVTGEGADLPARLRAAGAWAVLDGAALAALCGAAVR